MNKVAAALGCVELVTLIDNAGPAAVSGTFAAKPQDSAFTASGYSWSISYTGGTGNDVTLT
ncbi:MAG: hypothetical protein LH650_10970, partial [Chloroflexi bacterium]|nr:hypothetical protein [Chloroflexota bacterium]